ncbi:MAG TPA: lipopolysaccharide biosynthesis protein [Devosiaceae bacterium]|nr:lipopolysaccharide biosynthesis protein [Devosiaceae bacterium]
MAIWKRLASQSALLFIARIFGAGLTFLTQAAIARTLGSAALGDYLLIIATVNLIAVVLPLGFETTGTYFAAEYRAKGEGRTLRGFALRAYGHVVIMTLLLSCLGAPIAAQFGAPGQVLASHWVPACLLAFSTALILVTGALLIGLKRPLGGLMADAVFRPVFGISAFLLCLAAMTPGQKFDTLIWGVSLGITAVALVQFAYLVWTSRNLPTEMPARPGEWKRWWRFAAPWVIITLATDYFFDLDLLILSNLLNRSDLAIFGVCTRAFSLMSFGVNVVYSVTLPDMFESEAAADRDGFHRKIGDANLVASGLSICLFFIMVLAAPIALLLFGPTFTAGAMPLAVLCLSLVIRSVFGPASLVLSVHNQPASILPAIALGVATLVACNLLLVPPFGLMGAALAALASIGIWSAAQWLTVLRVAKVDVSLAAWLRRQRRPEPAPAE